MLTKGIFRFDVLAKSPEKEFSVIAAEAGIQPFQYVSQTLDPGFAPPLKLWRHGVDCFART
jgi:hypothetical protein